MSDPPLTPFTEGLEDWHEAPALLAENVVHSGRHLTEHFALEHAVALELTQLLGEHPLSSHGHQAPQLTESEHGRSQVIEDRHLVFAADDLERGINGGSVAGAGIFALGYRALFCRHSIFFVPTCPFSTLGKVARVNFLIVSRLEAR